MPIKVGILIISDRSFRGEREDRGGPTLKQALSPLSPEITKYEIIPDEKNIIQEKLIQWTDEEIDIIFTSGGTGLGPRDVTPEATLGVIEKAAPGFVEAMRGETRKIRPQAILSRAVAGIRKRTLIINLPGKPEGIRECLEVILPVLPHAVETLRGEAKE